MAIKYTKPDKNSSSPGILKDVYKQIKSDFGALVEPFTLHSSLPDLLSGVWMACRETEVAGNVPRELKETVAAVISRTNQCPYCVDAHTIMLNATGNSSVAYAVAKRNEDRNISSEFKAIIKWSSATRDPDSPVLKEPPFSIHEAPEIIGTAVFYHYINRMVSVFLDETPLPSNIQWLKGILKRMAGLFFSQSIGRPKEIGMSLKFLPEALLPGDMEWAKPNQNVGGAFARFTAVIDRVGEQFISENIRLIVQEKILSWNGKDPGLGRQWVETAISTLNEKEKRVGRIALLTAFAPYQIDSAIIQNYLEYNPSGEKLLGIAAWSSFSVARRIGRWLHTAAQ